MSNSNQVMFLKNLDVLPSIIPDENPKHNEIFEKEKEIIKNGIFFKDLGCTLRPTNTEDIQKLAIFYGENIAKTRIDSFVLEKHDFTKKTPVGHFIFALELLKEGIISYSDIISNKVISPMPLPFSHFVPRRYILYYNEITELNSLLKKIKKCWRTKRYVTAFLCFNRSYAVPNITNDNDSLIYLMTCAESLFLDGKEYRNTGSIMGIGCSMLIGKNDKEREKIKKDFELAYKIRSVIVHSKDIESLDIEQKEFIKNLTQKNLEIREYLRKSLNKLLS